MKDFVMPAFLKNHSVDDLYEKIKAIMPPDIDLSEGNHAWNLTRPTALVGAELCEFVLPEVIKLIYPEWSYGEFLDGHAKTRKMTRKAATAASGVLTVTGTAGAVIPAGSLFSTAAVGEEPSVDYETLEAATIPTSKTVKIPIQCTKTGLIGNTAENTIVLVGSRLNGITMVTNEDAITGGVEEETDEALIERILEYDRSQGNNYVGCPADYKRWSTSVDGVGGVTVISATDDTGEVTLIITDSNGDPATQVLCTAVYNYIMRPDDPGERLAPIGASLTVSPPTTISVGVSAKVELKEGATIETVKASLLENLTLYFPTAMEEGEIKYTRVASILSATEGVNDFSDLGIGVVTSGGTTYSTSNIAVTATQLPAVEADNLVLTSGTV